MISVTPIGKWDDVILKTRLLASTLKLEADAFAERVGQKYVELVQNNARSGKMGLTKRGTVAWYASGSLIDTFSVRKNADKSVFAGARDDIKYKGDLTPARVSTWLEYGTRKGIVPRPLFLLSTKEFFSEGYIKSLKDEFDARIQRKLV